MLDGVYAFVIIDGDKVIAGCGPFGLRPLYRFLLSDGRFGYASEIKQIVPNGTIIDLKFVSPFSYVIRLSSVKYLAQRITVTR